MSQRAKKFVERRHHILSSHWFDMLYTTVHVEKWSVMLSLCHWHPCTALTSLNSDSPIRCISVFCFPCYTSNLSRPAKGVVVQLLFGLEILCQSGHFLVARFAVDACICASPWRDRDWLMAALQEAHPSTSSTHPHTYTHTHTTHLHTHTTPTHTHTHTTQMHTPTHTHTHTNTHTHSTHP